MVSVECFLHVQISWITDDKQKKLEQMEFGEGEMEGKRSLKGKETGQMCMKEDGNGLSWPLVIGVDSNRK